MRVVCFLVILQICYGYLHGPLGTSKLMKPDTALFGATQTKIQMDVEQAIFTTIDTSLKITKTLITGLANGDNFKMAMADALASLGPTFDPAEVLNKSLEKSKESPVVMFSWTMSPACKKAKKLLETTGVEVHAIELDQPWDKGNQVRAVLGRHVGKTSVPMIFINGKYIGGCDDGPSDEAPGLVPLAFKNKLMDMLSEAGALKPTQPKVDAALESAAVVVKDVVCID